MRLTPEVVAEIVADYEAGLSSTRLQTKYELSKGSVLRLLTEAGVEMRRRGLSKSEVAVIEQRYEDGLTIREVAVEMGVPKTTVQDALERSGLPMRPAARRDSRKT